MDDYRLWMSARVSHGCVLKKLEGVKDEWEMDKGISRLAGWSEDAVLHMDPERPDDMVLPDNVKNIFFLIVVSSRLKEFLDARSLPAVEFLPVTILDHRGRPARERFHIVHATNPVDCLDLERSEAEFGNVDRTQIDLVRRLALDPARVDRNRPLFRLKHFSEVMLVDRDLADAISAAGFTGIRWLETCDYPGA